MDAGIGMLKLLDVPPFGQGKVIVLFLRSMQSIGIEVSESLHPVARAISNAIDIQGAQFGRRSRIFFICSSVNAGFIFLGLALITKSSIGRTVIFPSRRACFWIIFRIFNSCKAVFRHGKIFLFFGLRIILHSINKFA